MRDWNDVQGDTPSAFMQPKIDTVIYMLPTATYRYFSNELRDLERLHGVGKVAMQEYQASRKALGSGMCCCTSY